MRSIVAGLGLALLVVSPPVRSASLIPEPCRVEVSMGRPVEIVTGPVQVPQCVDDNDDSCLLWVFFCDNPEILHIESIALANCSLKGDVVPPLRFSVESSSKSIDFVPPFSGELTCDFKEGHRMSQSEIESLIPEKTAKRFPCKGSPTPSAATGSSVRCNEKP